MPSASSETIDWLLREMTVEGTSPEGGGFASSLDADSEGEEGKFYVWSLAEIEDVLGETDASVFAADLRRDGGREFRRPQHPQPARARSSSRDDETETRLAAMRAMLLATARPARPARLRRQGAGRLERTDDRGARQCGASVRPGRLARSGGARLRVRQYTDDCRTGGCCMPVAPARPRRRRPHPTTPT